jgi:hypothetical protein
MSDNLAAGVIGGYLRFLSNCIERINIIGLNVAPSRLPCELGATVRKEEQ